VLVVVVVVRGVPASVVDVVDVVPVRHRDVTAAFAVDVVVILMHGVVRRFAFVVVTVVLSVQVSVVHVVDMVAVWDGHVAASLAMGVVVISVLAVNCGRHCFSPPFRANLDS
jgi:hypothetical protein